MHLLRKIMWWVLSPWSPKIVYAQSGKLTGWLACLLLSPRSNENPSPARKWHHPKRRLLELRSLMAWVSYLHDSENCDSGTALLSWRQQGSPPATYNDVRKKSGKASSSTTTRQRWWVPGGGSPGRLCPALAESAGQLPSHRHRRGRGGHCIPATASAYPSMHHFPDQEQPSELPASRRCLADEGSHRGGHQRDIPRILQPVVPGFQKDRRSATCNRPVHFQPPHGSSTLQDGDAWVHPFSHQKSGVDGIGRQMRCLTSCSDASGRPQVSAFRGQQEGLPVHLSTILGWQLLHESSPSCCEPSSCC